MAYIDPKFGRMDDLSTRRHLYGGKAPAYSQAYGMNPNAYLQGGQGAYVGRGPLLPAGQRTSPYGQTELMGSYESAYEKARKANLDRYGEIKAGYQGIYDRTQGRLAGLGDQERRDIDTAYRGQQSRASQNLVSRGLAGTTIGSSVSKGIERSRIADQGRLQSRLKREELTYLPGQMKDKLRFMERREDPYPAMNFYEKYISKQGRQAGRTPTFSESVYSQVGRV